MARDCVFLFVGYRTRLVDGWEAFAPPAQAPAHYKDKDKIKSYLAEQRAAFEREAADQPYTSTFDSVSLIDKLHEKRPQWSTRAGGPPVGELVRNYLVKYFPRAWPLTPDPDDPPTPVVFVGFDTRRFLKLLGLECSLPTAAARCPLRLWYDNAAGHRDILEALAPREYRLSLPQVLRARRPLAEPAASAWDRLLADWAGPGVHPERDAHLALELAAQLGFLRD